MAYKGINQIIIIIVVIIIIIITRSTIPRVKGLFVSQVGEARALYNLGNVYHAKGKHSGRNANQDPGEFPPLVRQSLEKAAEYYE